MKRLMLMSMMFLMVFSLVSAGTSYRSDTGFLVYSDGYEEFSHTDIHTSLYESRGVVRGSIQITAETVDGERIVKNVRIRDVRMSGTNGKYILFSGEGYYYERYKNWYGRWSQRKVEGRILASYDTELDKTTIRGEGDLNFRVYRIYLNQL